MTKTCTHTYDNGGTCNSVAVNDQHYCVHHLRHRARLLRMAQARARSERFELKLPPLEDMHAVQSALNRLVEAVAADMIDLKRADFLLKTLRFAAQSLKWADKWPAPVFHSDQAASVDLTAEFGLPENLDLDTPPEVAFPPPDTGGPQLPDVGNCGETFADNRQPTTDNSSEARVVWPADAVGLSDLVTNLVTPEYVELHEIRQIQGNEAASARSAQMMRNERRRAFHSERKRFAEIAMNINLRRAAERLAERKLAAERAAIQEPQSATSQTKKAPAAVGPEIRPSEVKPSAREVC